MLRIKLPDAPNEEEIPEITEIDELQIFVGQKKNKIWGVAGSRYDFIFSKTKQINQKAKKSSSYFSLTKKIGRCLRLS